MEHELIIPPDMWNGLNSEGPPIRGSTALLTGFLVAYTQLIPEHQVQIFGKLKIRVKNTPGIALLASNVLTLVHEMQPWILIQFGFIVGESRGSPPSPPHPCRPSSRFDVPAVKMLNES